MSSSYAINALIALFQKVNSTEDVENFQKHVDEADSHVRSRRYDMALKAYLDALIIREDLSCRRNAGVCCFYLGNFYLADFFLNDCIYDENHNAGIAVVYIKLLLTNKMYDKALHAIRYCYSTMNEFDRVLHRFEGDIHHSNSDTELAMNAYAKYLEHRPGDMSTMGLLGKLLCENGRPEEGIPTLKKAYALIEKARREKDNIRFRGMRNDIYRDENLAIDLYGEGRSKDYNYFHEVVSFNGHQFSKKAVHNNDNSSEFVRVVNGIRYTPNAPEAAESKIFLFGASRVYGYSTENSHTIASMLQAEFNKFSVPTEVVNYGISGIPVYNSFLNLLTCDVKEGDSVIFFPNRFTNIKRLIRFFNAIRYYCTGKGLNLLIFIIPYAHHVKNPSTREQHIIDADTAKRQVARDPMLCYNLARQLYSRPHSFRGCFFDSIVQRPHDMGEIFLDFSHVSYKVNKLIAKEIFKYLRQPQRAGKSLSEERMEREETVARTMSIQELYRIGNREYGKNRDIAEWMESIRCRSFDLLDNVGAIVMNCNPFTLGHLHLIDYASKRVDALYIFVVQENRSFFPFEDRIRLIKQGVAGLPRKIHVVPSGEFIISNFSFPGYFAKQEAIAPADSTTDIVIFGSVIAPGLHIKHRFVGEEPSCIVTNDYNETMDFLLPDMGVAVHRIPRKEFSRGQAISASVVREALQNNDHALIQTLVPPTTYDYLVANNFLNAVSVNRESD